MTASAVFHLAATVMAAGGLAALMTPAARKRRGHPMTVLIGLLLLLLFVHGLSTLELLGVPGLHRLIDFCRLISPVVWFFLVYSWLQYDASRRLAESDSRFRMFMEHNPAIAFLKDSKGRYVFGNRAWAAQFGAPIEDLLGKTDAELWSTETAQVFDESDAAARGGRVVVLEERGHREADGRERWFEVHKFPVPRPSGEVLVGGVVMEVTARKRALLDIAASEARYRLMFERSPLPMWVFDEQTLRFLDVNPAAIKQYGYSRDEFLAMTLRDVRPPEDVPALEAAVGGLTDGVADAGIWRHRKKDGTIIDVSIHHGAITVAGRAARLVVLHDVTEQLAAQRRRVQLEAELAQVRRLESVGTLAAGVAHDFSNLLTALQGHLALADRALAPDHAARRSLKMVENVVQQGVSMTRNLLTFAHQMPSAKVPCNLGETVADVMHLFRHLVPSRIELTIDVREPSPWVLADRTQLQQVLMNLLLNARDAMPSGGKLTITVDVLKADNKPVGALLRVEDTGTGIDAETLERIFEPFFTTKAQGKGSGLGLAMVHGIVTDHGGRIAAHSTVGVGTRFDIELPLCEPGEPGTASTVISAPTVVGPRRRTVLLAAPGDYVREIMVTSLEAAGYPVRLLVDPSELAAKFDSICEELGCVVVDLDALVGDEPLTLLRKCSERTPVIVVTANTAVFLDEPATPLFQFLPKPFQMSQLIQRVDRALGINKAGDV
jgi:two-component system, cell cycle sensor histidine kinase and response regulator CckA